VNNTVRGNNIRNNTKAGITVWFSSNDNTIEQNNVTSNSGARYRPAAVSSGINVISSDRVRITDNTVLDNQEGITLNTSTESTVAGNNIRGNRNDIGWTGLALINVEDSEIYGNTFSENDNGMRLLDSYENRVYNNTFTGDDYMGLSIESSIGNMFYRNDFYDPDNEWLMELNDYCYQGQENTYHGFPAQTAKTVSAHSTSAGSTTVTADTWTATP